MTRLTIGGIAAGTFTLGLIAGLVLPGTLVAPRHDQAMAAHISSMGAMPIMDMGSMNMSSMPMMGVGSKPTSPGATTPAGHETHHSSPEVGQ